MPINFQVPQNLPPLGVTVATEGTAVRVRRLRPRRRRCRSVMPAAMQTYMQMQGGQQPGGPGGL